MLWCAGFLLLTAYFYFTQSHSDSAFVFVLLLWLLLGACITKAVFSFRAVHHFKNKTVPAKSEKVWFIILFSLNILFAAIVFLLSVLEVIPSDFSQQGFVLSKGHVNYRELLMDCSLFAVFFSSAYLAVFDLMLLKAVRKTHYDDLMSFEIGINKEM